MPTNIILKKQILWNKLLPEIQKETGRKYEVTVSDLDKDSEYFHPIVKLSDSQCLKAQCDLEHDYYYAIKLTTIDDESSVWPSISIDLKAKSFKEAISLIKRKKISSSVTDTLQDIKDIDKNIQYMHELKKAKIKLLNATAGD